ncbi:MAG TPA: zf-HC2 domain-containing protein [Streptosporangiaceae bacterium]
MSHERATDMTCADLVELVTDYLEGALGDEQRDTFEAHLRACDGCRVYLEQMRETREHLGHVPPDQAGDLPEVARQELLDAFRAENPH